MKNLPQSLKVSRDIDVIMCKLLWIYVLMMKARILLCTWEVIMIAVVTLEAVQTGKESNNVNGGEGT
jgi:hypothetical protein